jgi:4-amino-4-deoxy-L-arabinose transferase-like glycosyltransferase
MKGVPDRYGLLLVCALALAVRLVGLGWGLPNELHVASYHPDEWSTVDTALGMLRRGELDPRFFNYPSLSLYFATPALMLVGADAPRGVLFLAARLVTVLLAVLGVAFTARLGRSLGSPRVGLLAAAILALLPLHVVNSHFATVDVPLTTWCTLALWAACELAEGGGSPWKWTLLGALACGLAAGTKYNGVLALLPLLLGLGLGRRGWRPMLAALAIAAAVFALTSPYVFFDPQAMKDIRFELFVHPLDTNLFHGVGPGWWFHLRHSLPTACGVLVPLAALAGAWRARRDRRVWPLLLWLAMVALTLLRTRELFIRYLLPMLPVFAVLAALAVRRVPGKWRCALIFLFLAGLVLRSRAYVALMDREDPRDAAARWCFAHLPAGESIGELGFTWFESVPLRPNNSGHPRHDALDESPFKLHSDWHAWAAHPPDWLVINDTHRLAEFADQPGQWEELTAGYRLVRTFEARAHLLPGWTETGRGSRQHDWLYLFPVIEIWQRQD